MARCISSDSGRRARSRVAHSAIVADSLRPDNLGLGLPDAGYPRHRHMASSSADQAVRERRILEQLLAAANIEDSADVAAQLLEGRSLRQLVDEGPSDNAANPAITRLLAGIACTLQAVVAAPLVDRPCLADGAACITYLNYHMAHLRDEQVRLLLLDAGNTLIADKVIAVGVPTSAPLRPRVVVQEGLAHGATAIILVHNHPSGDPTPSAEDVAATRKVIAACRAVDIAVHDHLIIARRGWVSLRKERLAQF